MLSPQDFSLTVWGNRLISLAVLEKYYVRSFISLFLVREYTCMRLTEGLAALVCVATLCKCTTRGLNHSVGGY